MKIKPEGESKIRTLSNDQHVGGGEPDRKTFDLGQGSRKSYTPISNQTIFFKINVTTRRGTKAVNLMNMFALFSSPPCANCWSKRHPNFSRFLC